MSIEIYRTDLRFPHIQIKTQEFSYFNFDYIYCHIEMCSSSFSIFIKTVISSQNVKLIKHVNLVNICLLHVKMGDMEQNVIMIKQSI